MTEPVQVNSGVGIKVAVDDCGESVGVAQIVKLAYSADGVATAVTADADGLKATLGTAIAGERNTSSAAASYLVVRQEANLSIISKTTAVTIGAGAANDTHLMGLMISAALTGTCAITGFADSDGTAQTYTLPAASVGFKDFFGAINSAGALTITCSNASDDNLVAVLWRAR